MVVSHCWKRFPLLAGVLLLTIGRAFGATITGFTPVSGPSGTEVTIFGTGLQTTMVVYFGSTEASGQVVSVSATSVRARVPVNAFTGPISIFTSGSGAASSSAIFVAAPRVTEFEPGFGAPGTLVTISGVNFGTGLPGGRGNVTNVLFNGTPAAFQVTGLNQLVAQVPPNASTGPLTLANEAGPFSTLVSFQVPARIDAFTPTNGMPGQAVSLTGPSLGQVSRVEFGTSLAPAAFAILSPSNLVAFVPTNAVNGALRITTPAGVSTSTSSFAVKPRILSFSPGFGAAGTNVTLAGGGFHGVTAVRFGSLNATFTFRSSTQIDAVAPGGVGTAPLEVVTTNGNFVTEASFIAPASISTVNPGSGVRGDPVTVDGQNLNGVTKVYLNGVEAPFTPVSAGRLTFTVPALGTTGRVSVETPAGLITGNTTFTVRPVAEGFLPGQGAVGSAFQLTGSGLTNLAWVRLGGLDTSFTVLDSTRVRVLVPVGAYSGPVQARTTSGNETTAPGNFFVTGAQPVLTAFTPTNGQPGTRVTLTGQGFRTASRVQFGTLNATFTVVSPTQIDTTVPANADTGLIAVTTLDGIALSSRPFVVPPVQVSLSIALGFGAVDLRWPTSAAGFVLEETSELRPGAVWVPVTEPPVADGNQWRVTLALPETGHRWFRLRK